MLRRTFLPHGNGWTVSTLIGLRGKALESIGFEEGGAKRQVYLPNPHLAAVNALDKAIRAGATLRDGSVVYEDGRTWHYDDED